MNTAHQLLSLVFEGHNVRTVMVGDKPFFVAMDVCAAVEIIDHKVAVRSLLPEERAEECLTLPSSGKRKAGQRATQTVSTVSESGLFALVMRSRKPAAQRFRLWIGSEVIPQLPAGEVLQFCGELRRLAKKEGFEPERQTKHSIKDMPSLKANSPTQYEKELREKGWSLRTAAARLGCHFTHLQKVITGRRDSAALLARVNALPPRPRPFPRLQH